MRRALAATVAKLKAKQRKYEEVQADHDAALLAVGLQPGDQAAIAAAATNPIDVIKTRMQVAGANPALLGNAGAFDVAARQIFDDFDPQTEIPVVVCCTSPQRSWLFVSPLG